jgi:hypothetical protein
MDSVVEVDDGDHTLTSQVSPTEIYVEGQRRDPTSRRIADRTLDLPSCRRELTATPSVCPAGTSWSLAKPPRGSSTPACEEAMFEG